MLIDHAQRPRNNYPLTEFNGRARITGTCGDTMEVWVAVRDGLVEQATFTTDGCAVSHACGSMTTCMAEGRFLEEIEGMEPEHVIRAFSGLPPDHEHCAELSTSALKVACANVGEPGGGVDVEPEELGGVVVRVALPLAAGRVVGSVESAERFALLDVEAATMRVISRMDTAAPEKESRPEPAVPTDTALADAGLVAAWLQGRGVQVLLCGSMGEDVQGLYAERSVQVVLDAAPDIPEELVAEYLAGSLHHGAG